MSKNVSLTLATQEVIYRKLEIRVVDALGRSNGTDLITESESKNGSFKVDTFFQLPVDMCYAPKQNLYDFEWERIKKSYSFSVWNSPDISLDLGKLS